MSTLGPKLYQDDIATDLKRIFIEHLKSGKNVEEITEIMIEDNQDLINDFDDSPIFWFTLSDVQWDYGMLQPYVKKMALKHIEDGNDLKKWEIENPKDVSARAKVLENLKNKLNSPMPNEKNILKTKQYICPWKINDVFAYKLESDLAKEHGLSGRYLLIRKVDEGHWCDDIIPIVYISITSGIELPKNAEEIQYTKYIMGSYRHDYRMPLISKSKRSIQNKLQYLGNYQGILPPNNEFKIADILYMTPLPWWSFEKLIIDKFEKLGR